MSCKKTSKNYISQQVSFQARMGTYVKLLKRLWEKSCTSRGAFLLKHFVAKTHIVCTEIFLKHFINFSSAQSSVLKSNQTGISSCTVQHFRTSLAVGKKINGFLTQWGSPRIIFVQEINRSGIFFISFNLFSNEHSFRHVLSKEVWNTWVYGSIAALFLEIDHWFAVEVLLEISQLVVIAPPYSLELKEKMFYYILNLDNNILVSFYLFISASFHCFANDCWLMSRLILPVNIILVWMFAYLVSIPSVPA